MRSVAVLLYGTVWCALVCFVAAESGRRAATPGRVPATWTSSISAAGLALLLLHIALVFHVRYDWNHGAAVRQTAQQTAEVFGLDWGGGVYVNYLFATVWAVDSWWWHINPSASAARAAALRWALRAFYFVIIVNAAVIFVPGPRRWLGVVLTMWLLWTWRARRT